MCGINGYIDVAGNLPTADLRTLIEAMNRQIFHRGPDDTGLIVQDRVALGMQRLAIIDLENGSQPMTSADKSVTILLNGEIYNYQTLRKSLRDLGHTFRTNSDTEVALCAYQQWGTGCFKRFNGMFAIAIYENSSQSLVLARDRAGEKPLYYLTTPHAFAFSSELKGLLVTNSSSRVLDHSALLQYLQLTYIPAPASIFDDIKKLPAGHMLEITINSEPKVRQFWDMQYHSSSMINDYEACKKLLKTTLYDAVEECLVSDVPVGSFLSGGLDSSIITGIASQVSNEPIHTFTIGFRDRALDETARADRAARLHNTDRHHEYLDYDEILPELPNILSNIDEPFADSSYLATYMVSRFARQHVKTVLTGDGGDELFGGYSKYLIPQYSGMLQRVPQLVRRGMLFPMLDFLPVDHPLRRQSAKVRDVHLLPLSEQRLALMRLGFSPGSLPSLLAYQGPTYESMFPIRDYYLRDAPAADELWRTLYTDFKVVLEGDMLAKVDRSSMLTSLEARVPMLHPTVIDLAARIPSRYKISGRRTKAILRDTFPELIPHGNFRAPKRGFGIPISRWLRNELREDLLSELSSEAVEEQGIFNSHYVNQLVAEHLLRKADHGPRLWSLYVFQKWYSRYAEELSA